MARAPTRTVYSFTPATWTWRRLAPAPVALHIEYAVWTGREVLAVGTHSSASTSAATRRCRTWMVAEPAAGDHVENNLNPVGRAYYGFSTLLCTPNSLSQEVGMALGTQACPARIRDVTTAAGFARFRVVAQTPFNLVFEVRK